MVDQAIRRRVGREDLVRAPATTLDAVLKALGERRRLTFRFERDADEPRARREAACFDVGVEYGIAAIVLSVPLAIASFFHP